MPKGVYPRTEEHLRNQSESMKKRWEDPEFRSRTQTGQYERTEYHRQINSEAQKRRVEISDSTREKISVSSKKMWEDPERRLSQSLKWQGELNPNYNDGRTGHPHLARYYNMIDRCYNPENTQYKDYGGRGITVCDEWREDFWAFASHMDEVGPWDTGDTMDRVDNDGPYTPENVRRATRFEQMKNIRRRAQ